MLDLSRQKVLNLAAHHFLSYPVKSVWHLALGYHWSRRPQVLTIERSCCRTLVPRAFERICLRTLVPRTFARINGNFKVMQPQHVLFQDFGICCRTLVPRTFKEDLNNRSLCTIYLCPGFGLSHRLATAPWRPGIFCTA